MPNPLLPSLKRIEIGGNSRKGRGVVRVPAVAETVRKLGLMRSLHGLFGSGASNSGASNRSGVSSFMKRFGFGVVVALSLSACHPQVIPNTDVEDTSRNRDIIDFCESYRKAVERRDIPKLLDLAHKDYYEDGGNIDSTDDLDKAGLEAYLEEKFSQARAIRYEIRYRRIGEGREETLYIDYTYSASYQIPSEEGDVWRRTVADNRLELVPTGDIGFKILSGM